jgi:hypothetical protein
VEITFVLEDGPADDNPVPADVGAVS